MILNKPAKRRITSDWHHLFPELGIYAPLHLLRRVGPLLEGIVLDRSSSNDEYLPTFHVHSLLRELSHVSLTLMHRLRDERTATPVSVKVENHDSKYVDCANRLMAQSPLALKGDLSMAEIVEAYRSYRKSERTRYMPELFEDPARLLSRTGNIALARTVLDEAVEEMKGWPDYAFARIKSSHDWYRINLAIIQDPKNLADLEARQATALKIDELPRARIS